MLQLTLFPVEVLDSILSRKDMSTSVLMLWKCGDSRLNYLLSHGGVTEIYLKDIGGFSRSRYPKMLSALSSLRVLSIKRGSWPLCPHTMLSREIQALSPTLESLTLEGYGTTNCLLNFNDSNPGVIYTKYPMDTSSLWNLAARFPKLQTLKLEGLLIAKIGGPNALSAVLPSSITRLSILPNQEQHFGPNRLTTRFPISKFVKSISGESVQQSFTETEIASYGLTMHCEKESEIFGMPNIQTVMECPKAVFWGPTVDASGLPRGLLHLIMFAEYENMSALPENLITAIGVVYNDEDLKFLPKTVTKMSSNRSENFGSPLTVSTKRLSSIPYSLENLVMQYPDDNGKDTDTHWTSLIPKRLKSLKIESDFFGGSAPRLRPLTLENISLFPSTIVSLTLTISRSTWSQFFEVQKIDSKDAPRMWPPSLTKLHLSKPGDMIKRDTSLLWAILPQSETHKRFRSFTLSAHSVELGDAIATLHRGLEHFALYSVDVDFIPIQLNLPVGMRRLELNYTKLKSASVTELPSMIEELIIAETQLHSFGDTVNPFSALMKDRLRTLDVGSLKSLHFEFLPSSVVDLKICRLHGEATPEQVGSLPRGLKTLLAGDGDLPKIESWGSLPPTITNLIFSHKKKIREVEAVLQSLPSSLLILGLPFAGFEEKHASLLPPRLMELVHDEPEGLEGKAENWPFDMFILPTAVWFNEKWTGKQAWIKSGIRKIFSYPDPRSIAKN